VPVVAVLGNHDMHANRAGEVRAVLEAGGIVVLDRAHHMLEICDAEGARRGLVGIRADR
jgi:D-serine deaminase-like pyridoxal phosphate-dependent protein